MKRLIFLLALLLLLLAGCWHANESIPTAAPTASSDAAAAPETTEITREPAPAPTPAPGEMAGIEMELPEGLVATPGCPWVELTVSFPRVDMARPEADRTCSLTLEMDGETVAEWQELVLSPGLETSAELEFSFDRYQPDRSAYVTATLHRGEEILVRETAIAVNNYPEEVYLALSQDDLPYSIDVLRSQNVVIVYGRDEEDEYTVPVKVWLCSTGKATPTGDYRLGTKREWGLLFGNVYGQYISGITGDILFHSVPYERMEKDSLETEEYNKLGTSASMGCVRLAAGDVKWIYDNCPVGTAVHIYDAETIPVERPELIPLDPKDPRSCWDPTDPDPENPWNKSAEH